MTAKLTGSLLLFAILLARPLSAQGPLPVQYSEPEDEIEQEETPEQTSIDNQTYLREFEKQRRARVLSNHHRPSVVVIKRSKNKVSPSPSAQYPHRRHLYNQNSFYGVEYQSGDTTIRYYEGYQPNCCGPQTYIIRPQIAVPYKHRGHQTRPRPGAYHP